MKWAILILGTLINGVASALIKLAVTPPRKFPSFKDPVETLSNWPFWLGLMLYGGSFLLYALALVRLPLNVVYPILTSGSVMMVAFFSALYFQEPLHWSTMLGIFLVVIGVALITLRVT